MNVNQKTQCDYCVFKVIDDQSTLDSERYVEEKYSVLRSLIGAPKKTRNIHVGGEDDKTETCFIDAPAWENRQENTYCPDKVDKDFMSFEEALGLRQSKLALTAAKDANKLAEDANSFAREANSHARRAARRALLANIIPIIAVIIAAIAARTEIKWFISWVIKIFSP
jgi:hypothetical protein